MSAEIKHDWEPRDQGPSGRPTASFEYRGGMKLKQNDLSSSLQASQKTVRTTTALATTMGQGVRTPYKPRGLTDILSVELH